ncbi:MULTISPECIES: complement resistance protein TraT [Alteromonadaceae]|uniref:complement resistance protein TraT n=1 Tax=Alteromonadaceae TaxID=72275 RepID=UPI001C093D5C|nr:MULTISPECIES: complement resistance protein TraT [Aliiglaciecola]MBU2876480.1 complement resistance protein TraT [Aliiglaciecola lipolytica]MDO6713056.1 complement resistance protein TraT [Aliiglaciecola sp. 2_MG-2023]MDO6754095.1 complement resistance protein TraT [Aliiglaciecola sp. 1_MG-2023]
MKRNQHFNFLIFAMLTLMLSGCAAVHTSIAKKDLDVQTKLSTSIFVDAVAPEKRKIYLEVRSAVMEFDRNAFREALVSQISGSGNGYSFVDSPEDAQFSMSVFVRNLEKASPTAAANYLRTGFEGVAAGSALGYAAGGGYRDAAAGGLVGGLVSTAANAFVKDVTFLLVADIQIKERARSGVLVRRDSKINTKISDDGATTQTYSEATNQKEYRTRVVTTANKANLELEEAQPTMFDKTAYAMASFF